MISLFDQDNSGTISCNEFGQLFGYITAWQNLFQQHDRDRSGSIDPQEFAAALRHFGYNLSPQFVNWLMGRFDRQRLGKLGFDKYVYVLVCLQVRFYLCSYILSSQVLVSYVQFFLDFDQ